MSLRIITPSHAPDFPSFTLLHDSVLRNTDLGVRHVVIVPDRDLALFNSIDSRRLDVVGYRAILPRRFISTVPLARIPGLPRGFRVNAVNVASPWPPIRGWVLQQVVKLAVAAASADDVVVLIDSDAFLIRPLTESTFRNAEGAVRLYRCPKGIGPHMHRHVRWQQVASHLLRPPHPEHDSPDYISAFASWSPTVVRGSLARVQETTFRAWQDAIASQLEFSEFIFYGTYATTLADASWRLTVSEDPLCRSHWDPRPLTLADVDGFIGSVSPSDIAVHIQSTSSTPDAVLHEIARRIAAQ